MERRNNRHPARYAPNIYAGQANPAPDDAEAKAAEERIARLKEIKEVAGV